MAQEIINKNIPRYSRSHVFKKVTILQISQNSQTKTCDVDNILL